MKVLDAIFDEQPVRWGLRGDPLLWQELKTLANQHKRFISADELLTFLNSSIESIIGQQLLDGEYPYVEKFDTGGMSGGRIDCGFWLKTALPLLIDRFNKLQKP